MIKQLIYDNTKAADVFIADTFVKRFLGYMLQKYPHYESVLIKPCSSIHTYFMNFDIDVLFLDKNMCILRKIEKLGPGRIIMPVKHSAMVIEAQAGSFKNFDIGKKVSVL